MKIKYLLLPMAIAASGIAWASTPAHFEMTVEKVELLDGRLLKGTSITGTVTRGCIANNTAFTVYSKNKKTHENTLRILEASKNGRTKPPNGEIFRGEYATIYLPDQAVENFAPGDTITSDIISCKKTTLVRLKPKKQPKTAPK